ncbi:MAG: FAD:protein FMN transferase [Rhodocyclaceae bacterium]|jgi:thiamine biosynthesis lipoprotein|nr:FAD:protein FMN transferase [Rhodocyclaceae bacterium]MCW5595625.1 FAD:protein FMN transferase [Rhodocyclaceae bacterium]
MRCLKAALALAAFLLLASCSKAPQLHQREAYVFGTRVEVSVWGESADQAKRAMAAVLAEFDRLHRMLHAWQPSELTALNEAIARGERDIAVSPELTFILRDAAAIAARSDQLFNPAIGRLVGLWGFHSDEFKPVLPDAVALEAAVKAQPRLSDLAIGSDRVSSTNRAVQLDLGGYAKGYALDRAAALLRGQGVKNALINIGGNVMALGSKGGQPWRIGIQHPRAAVPLATLELRDGEAVGTSGDYQRYFELEGRRYCHLLDPRSGQPAQGAQAVTVLVTPRAGAGALSDAASKPLFIAAAGDWRGLAQRLGVTHALRIDSDGVMHVTAAFHARLTMLASDMKVVSQP